MDLLAKGLALYYAVPYMPSRFIYEWFQRSHGTLIKVVTMHSYFPLTPTTFLERTGRTFPKRAAVIKSGKSVCFEELLQRTRRLAQVLTSLGVKYGDRVGLLMDNRLQCIEAHFAIPAAGAVIVNCNPWLPSKDIAAQLEFCDVKLLIVSGEFLVRHKDVFTEASSLRNVLSLDSVLNPGPGLPPVLDYEDSLVQADDRVPLDQTVRSELDPIAINFTSGTTGTPKGVVFSHRAAYLHTLGQVLMLGLTSSSKYLWTLPMFHVNGWGHMWAAVAAASIQIVDTGTESAGLKLRDLIKAHGVTHLSGAPRLVRSMVDVPGAGLVFQGLTVVTGGAAPSPLLITQLEDIGVRLIHQYGLNETCGPYVVCEEQESWKDLPTELRTKKMMRQGVPAIHAGTGLRVVDQDMHDVAADGVTLGEIIMAGNTVASGYYNNTEATEKAFVDGWFHSGDMAVLHDDGYIEIKDRIKDLIYVETDYGWENISSIEVENVVCRHEDIMDVAVIGLSLDTDKKEGTLLVAFLERIPGSRASAEDVSRYCKQKLAVYKQPHYLFFRELPKTATGKIRKDLLVKDASARIASLIDGHSTRNTSPGTEKNSGNIPEPLT